MTTTPEDLAQDVLEECCIVDAEETAEDSDITKVANAYRKKYAELAAPNGARELIYWPREAIPEAVYLIVRDLTINEIAMAYGDPMDPSTKAQNELVIMKRLRLHVSKAQTGTTTRGEYF